MNGKSDKELNFYYSLTETEINKKGKIKFHERIGCVWKNIEKKIKKRNQNDFLSE